MTFSLNNTPEIKARLREQLERVEATAKRLNYKHRMPAVGVPVMAELTDALGQAVNLVKESRAAQSDRTVASKELWQTLASAFNSVNSAKGALEQQDVLEEASIDEIRADVLGGLQKFKRASLTLTLASQQSTTTIQGDSELAESIEQANRMDNLYERIGLTLNEYDQFSKEIPSAYSVKYKQKHVVIMRLPIVVVSSSVNFDRLASTGFTFKRVQEYPILDGQLVIGLNSSSLVKEKIDKEDFLENTLYQISRRLGRKFVLANDKPTSSNQGFLFYWAMEESRLSKFVSATHGGADAWGFPFKIK